LTNIYKYEGIFIWIVSAKNVTLPAIAIEAFVKIGKIG